MPSKIEWTDETWNPIIGCSKISEGCRNCYAERMAFRLSCMRADDVRPYDKVVQQNYKTREVSWTGKTAFVESALKKPLHWKKPRRVFVCSMGDLFHESINIRGNEIREIFRVMAKTEHTYMILTKRPERMAACINYLYDDFAEEMPNVWLGVTGENQNTAGWRVSDLLETPAAVHFFSAEPMLGPIRLDQIEIGENYLNALTGEFSDSFGEPGPKLDWVIAGCESGPHCRQTDINWIRDLRDQCKEAGTPFFLKQMELANTIIKMPDLDGTTWEQYPA